MIDRIFAFDGLRSLLFPWEKHKKQLFLLGFVSEQINSGML